MFYVIYEKTKLERPNIIIDDEINIGDTNSVDGIVKFLQLHRDIKIAKRTIYNAIKWGTPIDGKYYIYKTKKGK